MNNTVKILSLVSYKIFPPDMGGQKGIAFFNRYLSKHVNLICVTVKDNIPHPSEGYPVKNILGTSKYRYINPAYFFSLKKIIKEEKITHLLLEHPYYGWLAMLLKWFCKIKLVVHSHNIESLRFKTMGTWWWGILWHYEKLVHQSAHHSFFIQDDDRDYAIKNFKLPPENCTTITYGFEHSTVPTVMEKEQARQAICNTWQIPVNENILLFNGTLGYKPNLDALDTILQKINPMLLARDNFHYKIIICGSKLPGAYDNLAAYKDKNIIYAGFVEDINLFFKGCDIFINPVIDGGGIKTKLIEALGYNLSVISTTSGATGIPVEAMAGKIKITENGDWETFTAQVIQLDTKVDTPDSFYDQFYWNNIAKKAAGILNN